MTDTKLYMIVTAKNMNDSVARSLQAACERLGVQCERIVTDTTILADVPTMQFDEGSLLYRVSTSGKAAIIEAMFMQLNPARLTTIYSPSWSLISDRRSHKFSGSVAGGLRIIPTILLDETWKRFTKEEVSNRVEKIGGFPLIVKTLGLSHGRGVVKVDSLQDLMGYLSDMPTDDYNTILRKYLADYRHYRIIVVDGAIAAAIEYHKPDNDFRTNASEEPMVSSVAADSLPEDIRQLAIDSVALRSSILGGVDILVDTSNDTGYLAEVNIPCNYARAEGPTGIDISSKILQAMMRKRQEKMQDSVA